MLPSVHDNMLNDSRLADSGLIAIAVNPYVDDFQKPEQNRQLLQSSTYFDSAADQPVRWRSGEFRPFPRLNLRGTITQCPCIAGTRS